MEISPINYGPETYASLCLALLQTEPFNAGTWQSLDVSQHRIRDTYELTDVIIKYGIPRDVDTLKSDVQPNLPWADQHFAERVGGEPVNPPPSHVNWPWARHNGTHQNGDAKQFSHSYPERFWPKFAGRPFHQNVDPSRGIRYTYGDLDDVVNQLVHNPLTRQAYVPIWFPEDTGAGGDHRVPCTLGYHFMIRDGVLGCRYYMRSCDLIRHFRDDVYMAARLTMWMVDQINAASLARYKDEMDGDPRQHIDLESGTLRMYISSLHAFRGDHVTLFKEAHGGY